VKGGVGKRPRCRPNGNNDREEREPDGKSKLALHAPLVST